MSKALYRKWRPKSWDEVVAQDHIIQTLRNAVMYDRVAHAYLFAGPRGTGKTTTARLLAKAVNCLETDRAKRPCNHCEHCKALNEGRFMDLIEIDAASNTSVDDVRDLREKINFSPSQGQFKVYIIDEVHMLSTAAFNALLKTLEEPPPHAIFVLATTEIHKIPATVLSRCQRYEFRRIPLQNMIDLLKEKSTEEDLHVEEAVYTEIARQATGSLRDAISLLDQLTSTNEKITLDKAQKVLGTATNFRVIELVCALIEQDTAKGLNQIHQALNSGTDPRQFARQIVTYLRNVLLFKMGNKDQIKASDEVVKTIESYADDLSMPDLLRSIESFNKATVEEHANWHPGLGLELAFTSYLVDQEFTYQRVRSTEETSGTEEPAIEKRKPQTEPSSQPEPKQPDKVITPKRKITQGENQLIQDSEEIIEPEKKKYKEPPKEQLESEKHTPHQITEGITIHDVQQSWIKVKAMVGKHNPRTEALLNTAKLTGLKENTLFLGFTTDILKDMMEKEGNITLTADILEEVFNRPLLIKCIVTSHQGSTLPNDVTIEKDGMVSTATRDLGGKINSAEETK